MTLIGVSGLARRLLCCPGILERYTCDCLHDVDPSGWNSYLKHALRMVSEILWSQPRKGRTKVGKSTKDRLAIFAIRCNEDIKILGAARFGMNAHRMSADRQIPNSMTVERV